MAYTPNIPAATDLFSASQPQIQGNFNAILASFDVNHVDFNAGTDNGKHKFISMPVQSPAPTFAAGEVGMYSFLNPTTGKNELYINKTNQITVTQIPATASILSVISAPAILSAGWTYLPSGILLKWAGNITANGQTSIVFPTGSTIPAFTNPNGCTTVFLQIADGGAGDVDEAIRLTAIANDGTGFSVYASPRTTTGAKAVTFTYLAIGY
jgi:hypothetical protein